jgi:hypothetical protein
LKKIKIKKKIISKKKIKKNKIMSLSSSSSSIILLRYQPHSAFFESERQKSERLKITQIRSTIQIQKSQEQELLEENERQMKMKSHQNKECPLSPTSNSNNNFKWGDEWDWRMDFYKILYPEVELQSEPISELKQSEEDEILLL